MCNFTRSWLRAIFLLLPPTFWSSCLFPFLFLPAAALLFASVCVSCYCWPHTIDRFQLKPYITQNTNPKSGEEVWSWESVCIYCTWKTAQADDNGFVIDGGFKNNLSFKLCFSKPYRKWVQSFKDHWINLYFSSSCLHQKRHFTPVNFTLSREYFIEAQFARDDDDAQAFGR